MNCLCTWMKYWLRDSLGETINLWTNPTHFNWSCEAPLLLMLNFFWISHNLIIECSLLVQLSHN